MKSFMLARGFRAMQASFTELAATASAFPYDPV
jgi:hypothetical protein